MRLAECLDLLACPRCRGDLEAGGLLRDGEPGSLVCRPCAADYPIRFGIPDLRLAPDPWIGFDEEIAKIERVLARAGGGGFAALVRAYWDETPGTPSRLARRYERSVVHPALRERELLERLPITPGAPGDRGWALDLGCGTAPLAVAAALLGWNAVGVDVALRWLVLAKARAAEAGASPLLVAASADALPFRDGLFRLVAGEDLLDHLRDPARALAECRRSLRPEGLVTFSSPNRYAITPEAHTGILGLGWFPAAAQGPTARALGRGPFRETFPLSARAAERLLHDAGFLEVRVEPAGTVPSDRTRISWPASACVPAYERLRKWAPSRALLLRFGPLFEATARPSKTRV